MPITLRESVCDSQRTLLTDGWLLRRIRYLDRSDRDLLRAVIINNQSIKLVARLLHSNYHFTWRRVLTLIRRINSHAFTRTIRALPFLEPDDARLARLFYCHCLPMQELADAMSVSKYVLRRRLDNLEARIRVIDRIKPAALPVENRGEV